MIGPVSSATPMSDVRESGHDSSAAAAGPSCEGRRMLMLQLEALMNTSTIDVNGNFHEVGYRI